MPKIRLLTPLFLIKCVFLFIAVAHADDVTESSTSLFEISQIFYLQQIDSLQLSRRPVIPGSEKIFRNDSLFTTYRIDYSQGKIHFFESLDDTILVWYRYLPRISWESSHRFRPIHPHTFRKAKKRISGSKRVKQSASSWSDDASLNITGSKTLSLQVGSNQDMTLEQNLRVNLTGRVGKDVEVTALLTDENSPIQPEGNTTELEELDKILIRIKSPRLQGTFGDFDIHFHETELADYRRDVQGVRGDGTYPWGNFTIAAAVSRGEYHTNDFFGQEGNQGPYQLTAKDGSDDLVVLAGTEEIRIDGEKMRRGESGDYTIDYAASEITFTQHRMVNSQSRISVDFQYSNQTYNRGFYAATGGFQLFGNWLKLGIAAAQESDNKERPIELVLTDEDRAALRSAGDDPLQATRDGATRGQGEYDLVVDEESGESYYVYAGSDSAGAYQVRFSYVGAENGDYARSPVGIYYEYVGENQGDYAAVLFLPLPRRKRLVDCDLRLDTGNLSLTGEMAISQSDQNIFSDQDDGDNNGVGFFLKANMEHLPIGLGHIDMKAKARYTSANFSPLGRLDDSERDRRWNLSAAENEPESVYEVKTGYRPISALSATGSFGFIEQGDDKDARLQSLGLHIQPTSAPHIQVVLERNRSVNQTAEIKRWKEVGRISYSVWKLSSSVDFHRQKTDRLFRDQGQTTSQTDDTYRLWKIGLLTKNLKKWSGSVTVSNRSDQNFDSTLGQWQDQIRAWNQIYRVSIPDYRSISFQAEAQARWVRYPAEGGEESHFYLIDSKTRYRSKNRFFSILCNYRATNKAVQRRAEEFLFVGEGQGDYSYDAMSDIYYFDPNGDYYRRTEQVGDAEQTVDLRASLRIKVEPYRTGTPRLWRQFKSDLWLRVQEETRETDRAAIYFLNWRKFQQDETTLRGRLSVEETVTFFPSNRRGSIELRYRYQDDEINQYVTRHEEKERHHYQAQIKSHIAATWTATLRGKYERKTESVIERGEESEVDEWGVDIETTRRTSLRWEYGVEIKAAQLTVDDVSYDKPADAFSWSLKPTVSWSPNRKSRLQIWVSQQSVQLNQDANLPYSIRGSYKPGQTWNWRGSFNYRFFTDLTLSVHYSGSKDPEESILHEGEMKLHAQF